MGKDKCEEGHIGLFCELCDRENNFSMESTSSTCKKCDTEDINIVLRLISLIVVFIAFLSG